MSAKPEETVGNVPICNRSWRSRRPEEENTHKTLCKYAPTKDVILW